MQIILLVGHKVHIAAEMRKLVYTPVTFEEEMPCPPKFVYLEPHYDLRVWPCMAHDGPIAPSDHSANRPCIMMSMECCPSIVFRQFRGGHDTVLRLLSYSLGRCRLLGVDSKECLSVEFLHVLGLDKDRQFVVRCSFSRTVSVGG